MRYFLDFAYNGTNYNGWQSQPNATGVQEVVEKALSTILRQPVAVTGSGRTDTGVHAETQPVHLDLEKELDDLDHWLYKINAILPKDILAKSLRPVKPDAHARFDATERSYEYRISRRRDPFRADTCYVFTKPLDVAAMNEAANIMFSWTDFESFSKLHTDVKTFNCDVKDARWVADGFSLTFHVTANRFLRNMVRAMVGTLLDVGEDKLTVEGFRQVLEAKDRKAAGRSVPASGLFLTRVVYPDSIYLS